MSSAQNESVSPNVNDGATIEKVESRWKTHYFTTEVSEEIFTFRVLKMAQSLLIYIGQLENESLDELAMAVPVEDFVSTTIIGTQHGCNSQELAQQFTRRLKKQIFISCNVNTSNLTRIALVKRIAEEMKNAPDAF